MKNRIIFIFLHVSFLIIFGCDKTSEKDLIGVYTGDKVPFEFSDDNEYHYLILQENNIYYLKYNDIKKEGIKGSWKILGSKSEDTLNVQFNFSNQIIIGKLKGNTFLFEKPHIFDKRFSAWLYVKTNLESNKLINPK